MEDKAERVKLPAPHYPGRRLIGTVSEDTLSDT